DQTVLLQCERILSVSAFDSSNPPQGRVIDAHGGFLIPGLWDMHAHIQDLEDLPLYVANGVTGVRLMFGSKHTPSLRAKIASAPTSFSSPPILSPTFTTPLRFKPCGSAESTSTVLPSITFSMTPSIAPAKASCTDFLPAAD